MKNTRNLFSNSLHLVVSETRAGFEPKWGRFKIPISREPYHYFIPILHKKPDGWTPEAKTHVVVVTGEWSEKPHPHAFITCVHVCC